MDLIVFIFVVILVVLFWPIVKAFALLWIIALLIYVLLFRGNRNTRL